MTEIQNPHNRDIPPHEGIYTFTDCDKRIETDLVPICHYYQWGMISCEERRQTNNCPQGYPP